jgi:hypothetical protein
MRRALLPYIGTAVATALMVTAVSAVAGNGGGNGTRNGDDGDRKGHARVLTVVEHPVDEVTVDNAPTGDSRGDTLTFHNPVFDATDTRQVGTSQGQCVLTEVGTSFECWWTTALEGGQITVEGPFLVAGPSTLAITGGTGKYSRARGFMELRLNAKDPSHFDFVFHIER